MDSQIPSQASNNRSEGLVKVLPGMMIKIKSELSNLVGALLLPKPYRTVVLLVLVSFLMYLNWTGELTQHFGKERISHLADTNVAYLEDAEKQALKTYLLLTEFNAGLALLQSSNAGINVVVDFNVQLGNELLQVVSLVDKSAHVSLASMGILYSLKLIQTLCQWLSPLLFSLLLVVAFIYLLSGFVVKADTKINRMLGVVTSMILLLFLSVHLLFPLSLFACNLTEKKITSILSSGVHDTYDSVHQQMLGVSKKMSTRKKIESTFSRYEQAIASIPEKVSLLSRNFIRHMVTTIFNVLIFPLGYFYCLVLLSKRVLEHGFGLSKISLIESSLRERLNATYANT